MHFAKTVAAIALATGALATQATPLSYNPVVINPNPDTKLSSGWNQVDTVNFTFDLGTAYDKTRQNLESASIDFNFGNVDWYDYFKITLGSWSGYFSASDVKLDLVNTLPDLKADGKISGSISVIYGDITFKDATLTASYTLKPQTPTVPTNPVPEPASLALMGLGLGALALRRRNKA